MPDEMLVFNMFSGLVSTFQSPTILLLSASLVNFMSLSCSSSSYQRLSAGRFSGWLQTKDSTLTSGLALAISYSSCV